MSTNPADKQQAEKNHKSLSASLVRVNSIRLTLVNSFVIGQCALNLSADLGWVEYFITNLQSQIKVIETRFPELIPEDKPDVTQKVETDKAAQEVGEVKNNEPART
jgi:hypothetical protein